MWAREVVDRGVSSAHPFGDVAPFTFDKFHANCNRVGSFSLASKGSEFFGCELACPNEVVVVGIEDHADATVEDPWAHRAEYLGSCFATWQCSRFDLNHAPAVVENVKALVGIGLQLATDRAVRDELCEISQRRVVRSADVSTSKLAEDLHVAG